ncbi:MAG: rod shape-determining protein RodA [Rikenellaceae bacterium]|nr:rod shape-determining protein RodA [Rikenellaceae bacterium]
MISDNYYYRRESAIFGGVDWWTVLIYVMLVGLGLLSIYAAVYNEEHSSVFDMSQKYGSQLMWIGICMVMNIVILLVDSKYYHYLAYQAYALSILLLLLTFVVGRTINGAHSWIRIGPFSMQPVEFAKMTTALALGKYMSNYGFNIHRMGSLSRVAMIIALPALIAYAQNDTGSAMVFGSFLFMLYREGFTGWVYLVLGTVVFLFVGSFFVEPEALYMLIFVLAVLMESRSNGFLRQKTIYVSTVFLVMLLIMSAAFVMGYALTITMAFILSLAVTLPLVAVYAVRHQLRNVVVFVLFFIGSLLFVTSVDYVFDNVLKSHQQDRILDLLGLENDVKGAGYNVNQSKIAIGSGGVLGKGFLQGTQTKFDFVPEQSTDFIFCTVGEEWGFVGSVGVLALFMVLIYRLMRMGDKQRDTFGRVYCYGVAGVFFFHVLINIGMTIGIVPVIGIPLPFFSYGGSSLLTFSAMLFIAIRLNCNTQYQSRL